MFGYLYLLGVILLGIIWAVFFFLRKDLRKQLLLMSFFTAPLAPVSQILFFSKDYWNPDYILSLKILGTHVGIEEPLFAFFVGGIGSVLYEVVRNRMSTREMGRPKSTILLLTSVVCVFLLIKFVGINTIWASSGALLFGAFTILLIDRDLVFDALVSGFAFVIIAYIVYIPLLMVNVDLFQLLWSPDGLSGIHIWNVPIEEVCWFFAWGSFSGVLYEFYINVKKYAAE